MRDKKRIETMMKKLRQCWEFTSTQTFYDLLFSLYHDTPEQWTDYYKEDDFWAMNMEDYKMAHIANDPASKLNNTQLEILHCVEKLWKEYYDLRFPQIINLIYNIVGSDITDEQILLQLQKEVGDTYAN